MRLVFFQDLNELFSLSVTSGDYIMDDRIAKLLNNVDLYVVYAINKIEI